MPAEMPPGAAEQPIQRPNEVPPAPPATTTTGKCNA